MAVRILGSSELESQIRHALDLLDAGHAPSAIETTHVEFKEEPGRRTPTGKVIDGGAHNDGAAEYLASEMACMANTPGGGAIILGVADDGTRIGTHLCPDSLRHRIYELTNRALTISVRVAELDSVRLLVLSTHEAIEPIRVRGRVRWRVDRNCVDIDPSSWIEQRMHRRGFDWSARPSQHTMDDVSLVAVEIARDYLRGGGRQSDTALATATAEDLIRRLNLIDGGGRLNNAGALLFVGTPEIGMEYIRREIPGGDSTNRLPAAGRPWSDAYGPEYGPHASRRDRGTGPLLQQIFRLEQASQAANRLIHVAGGFAHRRVHAIPMRALREAVVNGVVHRDWHSPQPTVVEHVGDHLTVTSPGGFIGGVDPANIITHPATPRYRTLAEAMSALRLAEREGIGVDRMITDMLSLGQRPPEFYEIAGPYVRVVMIGGNPDPAVIGYIDAIEPGPMREDVDLQLLLDQLMRRGFVDARSLAPVLQRSETETTAAIDRVCSATSGGEPILSPVRGTPRGHPPAYRLSDHGREKLARRVAWIESPDGRDRLVLDWIQVRGRISSTETADLTGITAAYAGTILTRLADDGHLVGSRPQRVGRGFHYVPASVPS
ncbi:MAG: putative DNA binding domain-containing protein [bacterium]|nr:putative DNA binding domain-containing protein [bacterium]